MVRDHLKLEVVRLYYLENLSQNQIAKQMEISRSYVSKTAYRSQEGKADRDKKQQSVADRDR